jgi:WD40 repeat protein
LIAWSEESDTGIIFIVDVNDVVQKKNKKRTLLSTDCTSREYISLEFSPRDENRMLLSLSSSPDWMVILWNCDKMRVIANIKLAGASLGTNRVYHAFFHPKLEDSVCCLGNNVYRLLKQSGDTFAVKESSFTKKDLKESQTFSTNYLSYCVMPGEGNIIIGTDQGQIVVLNNSCEYKAMLATSPFEGFAIESILPSKTGFIIGGPDGMVYFYEPHIGDPRNPYVRTDKRIHMRDMLSKVVSLCLLPGDEALVTGLENNNLMQIPLNIDKNAEDYKPEFLVQSFHSNRVSCINCHPV